MASWHGKHLPERYQATPGKLLRLRIESIVNSVGLRIVTRLHPMIVALTAIDRRLIVSVTCYAGQAEGDSQ